MRDFTKTEWCNYYTIRLERHMEVLNGMNYLELQTQRGKEEMEVIEECMAWLKEYYKELGFGGVPKTTATILQFPQS